MPLEEENDFEKETDRILKHQAMSSFIREYSDLKVWQNSPTLYVNIPLFAVEQLISRRNIPPEQIKDTLITVFSMIPSFLNLAIKNLKIPSEIFLKVAVSIVMDAISFHEPDICAFINENMGNDNALLIKNGKVLEA